MKYKEFVRWCNDRACDGCQGPDFATLCIGIMSEVRSLPFWKREKLWQQLNKEFYVEKHIEVIMNKIEEVMQW